VGCHCPRCRVLPWLRTVFEGIEFPGGGSVKYRELNATQERAVHLLRAECAPCTVGRDPVVQPPRQHRRVGSAPDRWASDSPTIARCARIPGQQPYRALVFVLGVVLAQAAIARCKSRGHALSSGGGVDVIPQSV
jgi:hypothetical protein